MRSYEAGRQPFKVAHLLRPQSPSVIFFFFFCPDNTHRVMPHRCLLHNYLIMLPSPSQHTGFLHLSREHCPPPLTLYRDLATVCTRTRAFKFDLHWFLIPAYGANFLWFASRSYIFEKIKNQKPRFKCQNLFFCISFLGLGWFLFCLVGTLQIPRWIATFRACSRANKKNDEMAMSILFSPVSMIKIVITFVRFILLFTLAHFPYIFVR